MAATSASRYTVALLQAWHEAVPWAEVQELLGANSDWPAEQTTATSVPTPDPLGPGSKPLYSTGLPRPGAASRGGVLLQPVQEVYSEP